MSEAAQLHDDHTRDASGDAAAIARRAARDRAAERDRPPPRLSRRSGYSIFVGLMKLLLPMLAVALVALVVLWQRIEPRDDGFGVDVGRVDPSSAADSAMINPRYEGIDDGGKPFTVIADIARQVDDSSAIIDLTRPKGDMVSEGGDWLAVSAERGLYDRVSKQVELQGDVSLFHDQGYELRTERLAVDLGAGVAVSKVPVRGQGPFGYVNSQGLRVERRGDVIYFLGQSKMVFYSAPNGPSEGPQ